MSSHDCNQVFEDRKDNWRPSISYNRKYIFAGKWPSFNNDDDEILCIKCMQVPGTRGCTRINSKYNVKFGQYTGVVDHEFEWVVGEQGSDIEVWPLLNN